MSATSGCMMCCVGAGRWCLAGRDRSLFGIHLDVQAALGDEVSRKDLRDFFYRWVHRDPYLSAIARGEPRVGLDGEPVPDTSPAAAPSD